MVFLLPVGIKEDNILHRLINPNIGRNHHLKIMVDFLHLQAVARRDGEAIIRAEPGDSSMYNKLNTLSSPKLICAIPRISVVSISLRQVPIR